ncbi:GNAT family N-acetyltransferase [Cellulosimicrobium sp. PMB13]|uniref:GNAT family N-acetyltransferase n=1 Tax=Cellulosimicrobium sp. PMB13 TaxID=3120158 RepID=UPI003F4BD6B3
MSESSLPSGPSVTDAGPTGVLVRRATVTDRDAVWPLVPELRSAPDRRAFDRSYGPLLGALDTWFAVAELPDEGVVGYVLANRYLSFAANGDVCRVEEVAVAPAHRRRGVGRALLASAEDWAIEAGAHQAAIATAVCQEFSTARGYTQTAGFFTKPLTPRGSAPDAATPDGEPSDEAGWAGPDVPADGTAHPA